MIMDREKLDRIGRFNFTPEIFLQGRTIKLHCVVKLSRRTAGHSFIVFLRATKSGHDERMIEEETVE